MVRPISVELESEAVLLDKQAYHTRIMTDVDNWLKKGGSSLEDFKNAETGLYEMPNGRTLSAKDMENATNMMGGKGMSEFMLNPTAEAAAKFDRFEKMDFQVNFTAKESDKAFSVDGEFRTGLKELERIQTLDPQPVESTTVSPTAEVDAIIQQQQQQAAAARADADAMDEALTHMVNHHDQFDKKHFRRANETAAEMGGGAAFLKMIMDIISGNSTAKDHDWAKDPNGRMEQSERDAWRDTNTAPGERADGTRAFRGENHTINQRTKEALQQQQEQELLKQQELERQNQQQQNIYAGPTQDQTYLVQNETQMNDVQALGASLRGMGAVTVDTEEYTASVENFDLSAAQGLLEGFEPLAVTDGPSASVAVAAAPQQQYSGLGA